MEKKREKKIEGEVVFLESLEVQVVTVSLKGFSLVLLFKYSKLHSEKHFKLKENLKKMWRQEETGEVKWAGRREGRNKELLSQWKRGW